MSDFLTIDWECVLFLLFPSPSSNLTIWGSRTIALLKSATRELPSSTKQRLHALFDRLLAVFVEGRYETAAGKAEADACVVFCQTLLEPWCFKERPELGGLPQYANAQMLFLHSRMLIIGKLTRRWP